MAKNYASALTRDYLEYLGITEVSKDGTKIMKGEQELTQHYDGRYKQITLYDPAVRKATPVKLEIIVLDNFILEFIVLFIVGIIELFLQE